MTPEERAKALLRKIESCICGECTKEAAAAIRQARAEAIEECAKVADAVARDNQDEPDRECELVCHYATKIAAAIRSLKDKS